MKNLLLVLVLLASCEVISQSYYVISVEGEIYVQDQVLAPKDRLTHETQLRFVGAESLAYIMSPSKGYFVLSAEAVNSRGEREFLVAVKNALLPPSRLKNTAIRAGMTAEEYIALEDHYDILSFFRGNITYLDTIIFALDEEFLPAEDTRIEWVSTNGKDTLRRDLKIEQQRFLLYWPEELQSVTSEWEHQLVCHPWYEEDGQEPYTFQLAVPAHEQLRSELQDLREVVDPESDAAFLVEYAVPYITMRYGKVHRGHLQALVD